MIGEEDGIFAQALRWHASSMHDDMDWDGFTAWLEADARHRAIYDAVALGNVLVEDHRADLACGHTELAAANDDGDHALPPAVSGANWKRWAGPGFGLAIAASLVAIFAGPSLMPASVRTVSTAAESRTIALDDGSTVILAPNSSLTISGERQSRIALSGGAWFDIRHDPSRAMEITTGGMRIGDIGTRFDVQDAGGQLRVEVADGAVEVRSDALAQPVRLSAGRSLTYDAAAGTALVQQVASGSIGEWRQGRLTFDAAPLSLVAADLERYARVKVSVADSLRNRQFSGTLVTGNGEAALRDLSRLMGIELRTDSAGFMLDEPR